MDLNRESINGIPIDKWNIYSFKEGARRVCCPKCSDARKKKKAKDLSVNWEQGRGWCHHCCQVVILHTYLKRTYHAPKPLPVISLPSHVTKFFSDRGISTPTLTRMKIQYDNDQIKFPFFEDGVHVNTKSRGRGKKFYLEKGGKRPFYNIDSIRGKTSCIIVEGEIDVLSLIEVGFDSVISLPNGAQTGNMPYLHYAISLFDKMDCIIIATDQDPPGREAKFNIIRQLRAEVCYTVDMQDCKDANEFLVKNGADALGKLFKNPDPIPIGSLMTLERPSDQFYRIQQKLLKKLKGDGSALMVYNMLLSSGDRGKNYIIEVSEIKAAEETGMSRGKIRRCLQVLIKADLISRSASTESNKNLYELIDVRGAWAIPKRNSLFKKDIVMDILEDSIKTKEVKAPVIIPPVLKWNSAFMPADRIRGDVQIPADKEVPVETKKVARILWNKLMEVINGRSKHIDKYDRETIINQCLFAAINYPLYICLAQIENRASWAGGIKAPVSVLTPRGIKNFIAQEFSHLL